MEKNLGHATAYGYAKSKGYSGTEDEFAELMADYASVGQSAAQSAEQAAASATSASGSAATAASAAQTATDKASEAVTAADTATTKASEASASADTASAAATSASTSAQTATAKAGTATAKADEAAASEAAALSAKTDAESARDAAAQSASAAAESARTLTIDATLKQSGQAADAKAVGDEITDLKSALSDVKSIFDTVDEPLTLSSFTREKYITANGTEDTLNNVEYVSAIIDESAVGKQLLISGSAWYSVKPYVFVASNGAKQVADVPDPGSTPTQYTDIPFIPNATGTLYLNRYNNTTNNIQVAKAIYRVHASIKGDYLPDDVGDYVYDATNYTGINFETVSNKVLKGTTGVITDESNSNYRVTEYIDIHTYSKLMITACNFYSYGLYSFYDSNKTYIPNSGKDAGSGSTVTKIYNETVNVPDGAKYIVIGFLYNHMATPYLFGAVDQSILLSKRWGGLKWVCVGDSLTAYNNATAFHYFDYIRADSGIDVINMGVGGTGYMRGADNSNAFYQRVLSIANDCDVCTVFGSGNDLSLYESIGDYTDTGTTTICGCVNTFLDNYFSICPTAPIGIIAPTPWMSYPTTMVVNNHMDDYVEKLHDIANYRGVPFLDLYHGSNLRPENETNRNACFYNESSLDGNGDGVHPNELGHRLISPKIYEFLKTLLLD